MTLTISIKDCVPDYILVLIKCILIIPGSVVDAVYYSVLSSSHIHLARGHADVPRRPFFLPVIDVGGFSKTTAFLFAEQNIATTVSKITEP